MKYPDAKIGMRVCVTDAEMGLLDYEGVIVALETPFVGVDFSQEIIGKMIVSNRLLSLVANKYLLEKPTGFWFYASDLKAL